MSEDLLVRFIGLDLISNVANDIGYGVNRLAGRITALSAASSAQLKALAKQSDQAANQMAANDLTRAQKAKSLTSAIIDSQALQAASQSRLDQLENDVARRRSLRASEDVRLNEQMTNSSALLARMRGNNSSNYNKMNELESSITAAQQGIQSNTLANEVDRRKVLRQQEILDFDKNRVAMARGLEQEGAANAAYTVANERYSQQRIAQQQKEEVERIASNQRMVSAMAQAGTLAIFGGAALIGVAAALAAGFAVAADHAAHFEQQLLLIHTQAGASVAEVASMRTATMQLGAEFGFTATEAATAAFHIESVGLRGTAAIDTLKAAMQGARVGAANLEDVTNLLAVVMAAGLVKGANSAMEAMAVLNAIVGQGNIRMEDLTTAFRTGLIGAMQVAGVSIQDTGAALATLTDLGYTAATAGTALRTTLTMIASPTAKAAKILHDLGMTQDEVGRGQKQMSDALMKAGIHVTEFAQVVRSQGIEAGLELLKKKFDEMGLTAAQQAAVLTQAFGGSRMGAAFKVLFENLGRLDLREKGIAKSSDPAVFAAAWQATSDLITTKVGQLESALNTLMIVIGEALTPTVVAWLGNINSLLGPMLGWAMANQALIAQFAPFLVGAIAIAGVLLILVGGLALIGAAIGAVVTGLAAFAGPVGIVILIGTALGAAMSTAAVLIATAWSKIQPLWDGTIVPSAHRLLNVLAAVWQVIKNAASTVMPQIQKAFDDFASRLTAQHGLWDDISGAFENFSKDALNFIKSSAFASLVADFAVTIPAALKITIDAFFLVADAAQLALTMMVTQAKVDIDLLTGHFDQAQQDAQAGADSLNAIMTRMGTDNNAMMLDLKQQFDGTNAQMWQTVYDQTMHFTSQLNADGTKAMTSYVDSVRATTVKGLRDTGNMIYSGGVDVGQSMADGIEEGLKRKQKSLEASVKGLAIGAQRAALQQMEAGSPSEWFAREVGEGMIDGTILGILRKASSLASNLSRTLQNATPTPQPVVIPIGFGKDALARDQQAFVDLQRATDSQMVAEARNLQAAVSAAGGALSSDNKRVWDQVAADALRSMGSLKDTAVPAFSQLRSALADAWSTPVTLPVSFQKDALIRDQQAFVDLQRATDARMVAEARSLQTALSVAGDALSSNNRSTWRQVFMDASQAMAALHGATVPEFGQLVDAASSAATALQSTAPMMFASAISVGEAAINGVEEGIKRKQSSLEAAMKGMAKGAQRAAMAANEARSPSELFAREVGEGMVLGTILGVQRTAPSLNQVLQQTVLASVPGVPAGAGIAPTPAAQPVVDVLHTISATMIEMLVVLQSIDKSGQQEAQGAASTSKPVTDGSLMADLMNVISQAQANRARGVFSYSKP